MEYPGPSILFPISAHAREISRAGMDSRSKANRPHNLAGENRKALLPRVARSEGPLRSFGNFRNVEFPLRLLIVLNLLSRA